MEEMRRGMKSDSDASNDSIQKRIVKVSESSILDEKHVTNDK
jgi:hypothetical protein